MRVGYKMTEVGEIPISWNISKLGEICDVRDGTHDSPVYFETGIPFVTSKNLSETKLDFTDIKYISIENHIAFSRRSHVENGDILFGMIGTIGYPIIVNEDFEFSIKNVALIKFKDNKKLHNVYALNILKSSIVLEQFKKVSNGGVLNFVGLGNIRNLSYPVPPLSEQQKIAEILTTVDDKIDVINTQIIQTQELKKGLMQQLLTRGIGHTKFKDSVLGEIPESWEVIKILDIGNVVTGNTPKTSEKHFYTDKGFSLASPADLGKKKYISSTIKQLTKIGFEQTRKLPSKAILVTCIGSTIGKIGMAKIPIATNQQINSIVCNDKNEPEYFYYVMESMASTIKSLAGTQAVPLLNKSDFSAISIIRPPIIEQKKIAEILSSIDEKLDILETKRDTFTELKKGLMQQLLTGKIRIK